MTQPRPPTIVIVSSSSSFIYLVQRYADRIGYSVTVARPSASAEEICHFDPLTVVFSSIEKLEESQALVIQLTNCDVPIIVCSSMTDEIRTRDLGADYCLLHPFTYDDFQNALANAIASKRA